MAELGLLAFARTAREVGRAVLPLYRTRFSKHQFTQPQLLAILCLMRYEDWTFREAEVRLREHRELRQVLGLRRVPDFTTLYRFLERLDDQALDRAVGETVRRMRGWRRRGPRRARGAVDATGLAQGAVSTYFVRRLHHHGQKPLPWRHWLKWLIVADLDQQLLLSQSARRGPWNDCGSLPAVVETASEQTRIGLVLADAEFDSERNHTYIRRQLGARSVIPAKRGKKTWRVRGVRAEMRRAFPHRLYRRRALIETVFSSVKRKLSARAPGRSLRMQTRQALLLGLSFNLYRLKHRYLFLRMSTEPYASWIGLKLSCENRGIPAPSYKTFCVAMKKRSPVNQTLKRRGGRAAYQLEAFYWELDQKTPRQGDCPFEIVHIDHTELDVESIAITGQVLGRPWMTMLSRMRSPGGPWPFTLRSTRRVTGPA